VDVRYFNSDGSEAFCGNGSRCAAWWAFSSGLAGRKLLLRTLAGELEAEITVPGAVRMRMPDVSGARIGAKGRFPGGVRTLHFLDTGAPHAVVPVRSVADVDVERLGGALRRHPFFGPAGANVNFVEMRGRRLLVRTYERGVEGETLACGTGLTASAVAFVLSGGLRPPVRLVSRSGDGFTVALSPRAGGASAISIEGPARTVFQGEIEC
jgi:diaminopimelate epimerase